MSTLQEDLDNLREAWLDLAYEIFKAVGLITLLERRGVPMKPWERQIRDKHK